MPNYTATSDLIAIPERGVFQYTETHSKSDNSGNSPLDPNALQAARTGTSTVNGFTFPARTLVFRYYYIEQWQSVDTLSQGYLDSVAADLAAVRSSGCKAIIRFAYTANDNQDAPLARVLTHIDQLATVINKYADVVHALQAGFIGQYGEWYYSANYGDQGNLNSQNIADRNTVISRLLTRLDSRIFVLLRYVGTRQTYLGTANPNPGGSDAARLGLHNDAFLAPYGDYGTYTTFTSQTEATNRAYVEAMRAMPNGGESASYGSPGSDWPTAGPMLQSKHWSFINPNYHPGTISSWGQANLDAITRQLGHRLRLVSFTMPSTVTGGQTTSAQIVLTNDGWTQATRNRPVNLILDNGSGSSVTIPFSVDLRTIDPGQQITATASFTAPTAGGTYSSYLALPDPSSLIANRADYALRLANDGIWDATTGRHRLSYPVTVSGTTTSPGGTTGGSTGGSTGTTSTLRRVTKMKVGNTIRVVRLT